MLVSLQIICISIIDKSKLACCTSVFFFKIRWGKHYMKSVAFGANLIT